jgi:hypothetical protein
MKKNFKESDFQNILSRWIKDNFNKVPTGLYESKISKGGTVNFNAFQPQQIPSLNKAATKGLYFKLSDASLGAKPADFFFIRGGFLALMFNITKQQKKFYFLEIKEALKLKAKGQKSIKESDTQLLGLTINL